MQSVLSGVSLPMSNFETVSKIEGREETTDTLPEPEAEQVPLSNQDGHETGYLRSFLQPLCEVQIAKQSKFVCVDAALPSFLPAANTSPSGSFGHTRSLNGFGSLCGLEEGKEQTVDKILVIPKGSQRFDLSCELPSVDLVQNSDANFKEHRAPQQEEIVRESDQENRHRMPKLQEFTFSENMVSSASQIQEKRHQQSRAQRPTQLDGRSVPRLPLGSVSQQHRIPPSLPLQSLQGEPGNIEMNSLAAPSKSSHPACPEGSTGRSRDKAEALRSGDRWACQEHAQSDIAEGIMRVLSHQALCSGDADETLPMLLSLASNSGSRPTGAFHKAMAGKRRRQAGMASDGDATPKAGAKSAQSWNGTETPADAETGQSPTRPFLHVGGCCEMGLPDDYDGDRSPLKSDMQLALNSDLKGIAAGSSYEGSPVNERPFSTAATPCQLSLSPSLSISWSEGAFARELPSQTSDDSEPTLNLDAELSQFSESQCCTDRSSYEVECAFSWVVPTAHTDAISSDIDAADLAVPCRCGNASADSARSRLSSESIDVQGAFGWVAPRIDSLSSDIVE